ncbi:MAG TPA: hypothetical protein VEZ46_00295 [Mycobacteriales bacterium]|jgi:hypothetical protein|nr:hypothetical protein [Mycobacteriales bacterium]
MNTLTTIGGYALGLVAVFAAATGIGAAVGPIGRVEAGHGDASPAGAHGDAHQAEAAARPPTGLSASEGGYLLRMTRSALRAGEPGRLEFAVHRPDGGPLTHYQLTHDKELHLIVVRRDLTGFQHLHPVRDPAGVWSTDLSVAEPGQYKVFADFQPAGADRALTLAADLAVAGDYRPRPLPAPERTAAVDGYTVALAGDLTAGAQSELTLSVSKDGVPVTDLQPYLAAYGHLVVLRATDLAYLHVHPAGEPGDGVTPAGPQITFFAEVPTAGDYRLFLDFQHAGVVRTAEFTAHAAAAGEHR